MSRTPEQIVADYKEFRGKCRELSEAAVAADPTLRLVRGHYFCPIWRTNEGHWWCVRPDGTIYDPSARQFPSNGNGIYEEFDGMCECENCGKHTPEEKSVIAFSRAFCSNECYGEYVGVY